MSRTAKAAFAVGILFVIASMVLAACVFVSGGCGAIAPVSQQELQQVNSDLSAARQEWAKYVAAASTQPTDSKERQFVEKYGPKVQSYLDKADQIASGDDPTKELLLLIPGYGGLAAFAYGFIKQRIVARQNFEDKQEALTALKQTVKGIDAAHPEGLPPTLKQSLNAAQDESTKKLVAVSKAS